MGQFKTDAHLLRIRLIHLPVGNNDETSGIETVMVDRHLKHFQTVIASCCRASDSYLASVLVFCHFLGRHGRIGKTDPLPVRMLIQIDRTLHQCLRVGIDRSDLIQRCSRQSQQGMIDLQDLFSYNVIVIFFQQIIDIIDFSC